LDLAQFRELESFAQFGSDLDESTKKQIELGKRLTELLKQPQLEPAPVEEQVVSFFAATNGLLDKVPVEKIKSAEESILQAARSRAKDILSKIKSTGDFDEKDATSLTEIIKSATIQYEQTDENKSNEEKDNGMKNEK
jgi:F-type H+-transporting ATPase subunit alpha